MRLSASLFSFALFLGLTMGAAAQVNPPAPQSIGASDGIDGPGFARLAAGSAGYVDPQGLGYCRYVGNGRTDGREDVIPISNAAEWQSYRSGQSNGQTPPGISETVCCRPQTVTLCQGAAGGTVTESLPYTVLGQIQQPVATCTDQWGATYTDSQSWSCGSTIPANPNSVMADGQWNQSGGDSLSCTPNAFTSGCSASCGGGSQTTYDSCGNVQAVNACNTQSCCTPNGSCSGACGGGSGTDNCGNPCVNNSPCAPYEVGYSDCILFQCSNCGDGQPCWTCGPGCNDPGTVGEDTWDGCQGICSGPGVSCFNTSETHIECDFTP